MKRFRTFCRGLATAARRTPASPHPPSQDPHAIKDAVAKMRATMAVCNLMTASTAVYFLQRSNSSNKTTQSNNIQADEDERLILQNNRGGGDDTSGTPRDGKTVTAPAAVADQLWAQYCVLKRAKGHRQLSHDEFVVLLEASWSVIDLSYILMNFSR